MGSMELLDSAVTAERSPVAATTAIPRIRERFEIAIGLLERFADLAAVLGAATLAYATYEILQIGKHVHYPVGTVLLTALGFSIVFVLMLDEDGAYKRANSLLRI